MYTITNFKSKAALKRAVADGYAVRVYQPNSDLTGATPPDNGTVSLEGPHFPAAHTWYARATLVDGVIVKVT